MEKAKQALRDFVPSGNKHHTTLDQDVRGAVTDEHVKPHQHENVTTALDKEIHQDHHHTVIQPIKATETLPEQHKHNIIPVEHRSFDHGNDRDVKATLERDASQFKDKSVTHETTQSKSAAPMVAGERTFHHVHEHIQPVIQKETIQPTVVHTTIPIHETHHAATLHHGTSTLPPTTMEEFSRDGGKLQGRGVQKLKEFEGCPTSYKENMQNEQLEGDRNMHLGRENVGTSEPRRGDMSTMAARESAATTGTRSSGLGRESETTAGRNTAREGENLPGTRNTSTLGREAEVLSGRNSKDTRDSGVSMSTTSQTGSDSKAFFSGEPGHGTSGTGATKNTSTLGSQGTTNVERNTSATTGTSTRSKPSLMDKLNPMKDADGDGKKGFMH